MSQRRSRDARTLASLGHYKLGDIGVHADETLQPDRYYLLSDAGSFFFDPAGDNDGFESPEAAAEWAVGRYQLGTTKGAPSAAP